MPMGHEFRTKPVNFMKIRVFQWFLDIFSKTPIQSLWKSPILTVFDRTGPIGHHRQDGLTGQPKTPYQSSWKSPKLTKNHEISTKK